MGERPAAFWCRIPSRANFGDALSPWLIHKLSGQHPVFVAPDSPRTKYLVTGSIAGFAGPHCVVWGAGIIRQQDKIARGATLLAVRGPLTRQRAISAGIHCPEAYGDPALLLPRLYNPAPPQTEGIGLALHYSDAPWLLNRGLLPQWLKPIDMQASIETVIATIRGCQLVVSTSLHGIITAHAYGIAAVWAEFRPLPEEDGTKFRDYLLSIGHRQQQPLRLSTETLNASQLQDHAIQPPTKFDLTPLWEACPFRRTA